MVQGRRDRGGEAVRHELKTLPGVFLDTFAGLKTFEIRVNDRGFKVGDILCLREWDFTAQKYTGNSLLRRVTYLLQGRFGLPPDLCVMQLEGAVEAPEGEAPHE